MRVIEHEGYAYSISIMHSNPYYGNTTIYWVRTDNPKWALGLIAEKLLGYPNLISKGYYKWLNQQQPSPLNQLRTYYEGKFVEDELDGHYEIIVRSPYDD